MVVGRGTWLKISTCGDIYHIHARKVSHTLGNNIQILGEISALECGAISGAVAPMAKSKIPLDRE